VTAVEVLFGLLGVIAVLSAALVVTTRQLVHAALWLVVTLGSVAGLYLLLSAEFVAWVQVLI
jgi:NADH-quinone oxidoreductase subunit J